MNTIFDKYIAEIILVEVIRGNQALQTEKKANMFNSTPPEGKEYLFAKFKIKGINSYNDNPIDISSAEFDLYSSDGVGYDDFVFVAGLESFSKFFAGAETSGYATFYIDKNDKIPNIVFLQRNSNGVWFKTY